MKCPHCPGHLASLEFADMEVDYCFTCAGIWLDADEMEHLLRIEGGTDDLLRTAVRAQTAEKPKRCPVCRNRMDKILIGQTDAVLLDRCKDHGMWSDAGELKKILALSGAEGSSGALARVLNNMFSAQKRGCT
jgi:Zn-finger nucleic acid-binding protein